jgi:hypothetical protein
MGIGEQSFWGNELFQQVVEMTGLPYESVAKELHSILVRSGSHPDRVTVDELRDALLFYLRETIPSESAH